MNASLIAVNTVSNIATFNCPGCSKSHSIRVLDDGAWTLTSGKHGLPTITPSILVTNGHYVPSHKPGDECWCTWEDEDRDAFICIRCHSFVTDGRIQFLSDSTHALAGQTVDLHPLTDAQYAAIVERAFP